MFTKPKFKDCFHVEIVEPENVFLLTEDAYWILSGRIYKNLAPLLTGQHTVEEIVRQLDGQVNPPEVYYALTQLEAKGYLMEADGQVPSEQAAFWQSLGVETHLALERLSKTSVSLISIGDACSEPLRAALEQLNIQIKAEGDLTIVVTDNYLAEGLDEFNRQALSAQRPWLLVRLKGTTTWIGPLFQPGETACWACMAQRIQANRQLESYIQRKTGRTTPLDIPLPSLPATLQLGANLVATEVLKWIVQGRNQQLTSQLITFNVMSGEAQHHPVVRRPQCPVCGTPVQQQEPRPIQLVSYKKRFTNEAGHRSSTPDETYARYQHHISSITGVVSWLVDLTEEINGLAYSYAAGHNFAMIQDNLFWLQNNLRSRTGGKGTTEIQAKVSALSEAIERYSGVYRGEEFIRRDTYRALTPHAIHVHACLSFSEKQYATRHTWNKQIGGNYFHVVPNPFNELQEIDWVPAWSLTSQEFKYLPAAFCYFGHPESRQYFFCAGDSNGTAAGNTLEEAILQGFLELVERDSVAIWWYNRIQRPAVDLASFNIPYLQALQTYYAEQHREFWVLDLTTDLQIPTFAAVSRRTDRAVEDVLLGFGAHLDPKIALLRAVTELNQFLPAVSRVAPDGSTRYNFPDGGAIEWWKTATLANQPYLAPRAAAAKTWADFPRWDSDDLKVDVETCVSIAQQAGLETLVLDQTRPDIGMSVCRVVVPGLRHFWRRLGPGRLYDVPVKLGWLDRPTAEEDLNPLSIFF